MGNRRRINEMMVEIPCRRPPPIREEVPGEAAYFVAVSGAGKDLVLGPAGH